MRKLLIIGATSAIAQEAAKKFAVNGDALYLVARDAGRLAALASDLKVRGAFSTGYLKADLNDFERHEEIVQSAMRAMSGLDSVLVAHGSLGDQKAGEKDYSFAEKEIRTNFLSVVSILTPIANLFEQQKVGTIAVITSVAGDRGRQSNYIYGASKGGLSVFLSGLRNRLARSHVAVVTIKPGFVDTPMTSHVKKGLLFASAPRVGAGVYRAMIKKRDEVYLPGFWWFIMRIVKSLPERIFKRLQL